MKLFDKILYELLTKHYVERNVLQAMNGSAYGVNKQLKLALEAGFVKSMQHTIREGRHQKTIDIFCLTTKGFQYIRSEMTSLAPWVERVAPFGRVRIAGPSHSLKTIAERHVKISTAAAMADFAGAAEYTTFLTSDQSVENNGSPLMSDLVTAAFRDYYREPVPQTGITFKSSLEIKSSIVANAQKNKMSEPDLRGGRYAGIMDGPAMTALVYTSRGIDPLIWDRKFQMRESAAYMGARRLFYQHNFKDTDKHAIMLVHDFEGFVRAYKGLKSIVRKAKGKTEYKLGDGFTHFWVVPVNNSGVHELRRLLTIDRKNEVQKIMDAKLADPFCEYYKNDDFLKGTFPLRNEFNYDAYVAVCLHVDVVQMRHIRASILRYPGREYMILCRRWQIPFYQEVLGDMAMIEAIDGYTADEQREPIKMAVEIEAEAFESDLPTLNK